jgi:DNA replication protein DnaC
MFVPVSDLLDHLRATFSPTSPITYDRRFDQVRDAPLLVLDDLGTQSSTAWAQEKLFQLLNHRYNAALPTVITTSSTLEKLDRRLTSRIIDTRLCTTYAITAPSYLEARPRRKRKA